MDTYEITAKNQFLYLSYPFERSVDRVFYFDCLDSGPGAEFVWPGNPETCDNLDNDCINGTDDGCDDDGDNYYVESSGCDGEPGFLGHDDCNDNDV